MQEEIYAVFIIRKKDGLCLFSKQCNPLPNGSNKIEDEKYDILTGFVSAVSNIITHVTEDYIKHLRLEGEDKIKIIVESSDNLALGVVASKNVRERKIINFARNLIKQFEYLYGKNLVNWQGEVSKFKVFDKVLNVELGKTNMDFTDYL